MFDLSVGKVTVVEFIWQGELHKSIRWTTAPEIFVEQSPDIQAVKQRYKEKGAEVITVKHVELSEIEF